jgi:hypothetical protein
MARNFDESEKNQRLTQKIDFKAFSCRIQASNKRTMQLKNNEPINTNQRPKIGEDNLGNNCVI